jgi:hypothetical protein
LEVLGYFLCYRTLSYLGSHPDCGSVRSVYAATRGGAASSVDFGQRPGQELWAKVGDGMKGVRRRIVEVFDASTSPLKK